MPSLENTASRAHDIFRSVDSHTTGSRSLKQVATSSHDLLQALSKGGKKNITEAKLAAPYCKVIKAINELDKIMIENDVAVAPQIPAARAADLQIVATVPWQPAPTAPPPAAVTRYSPWAAAALQEPVIRLRWLFTVFYVPGLIAFGCLAMMSLAGLHVVTNPDALLDIFGAFISSVPEAVWLFVQRLTRAAYYKLFASHVSSPRVVPQLGAPAPHQVQADSPTAPFVLLLVLALGWWISAPRPARP